ncbi:uncharacterized protein LOC136085762 [Hydra vulgaris]|uniref:Uncharacterized protein LOC136085762 n=1 Tax=Hydra vulgaris TaxID=6087 RepID=A0ABM4CN49_HYDVU
MTTFICKMFHNSLLRNYYPDPFDSKMVGIYFLCKSNIGKRKSHWIKDDRVFWPEGAYVERSAKNLDELDETWPSYKLVKVKFTADDYEWCKDVEMSTTEHDSDAEPVISQATENKIKQKIDLPKPFTKSIENKTKSKTKRSKSVHEIVDLPISSINSLKRKLSHTAELNIIPNVMGSSFSSRPLQPETAKDLAGSCKRMYPLPDAEFQRKVMFQLAEIKNLLIHRTAHFLMMEKKFLNSVKVQTNLLF